MKAGKRKKISHCKKVNHQACKTFYYQGDKLIHEINPQINQLSFLYSNAFGRIIRRLLLFKSFNKLVGRYYDSSRSVRDIAKFIRQYHINMSDYEEINYTSFNQFFARKLKPNKRTIDTNPHVLAAPCDGKLFVIPKISPKATFYLKELPFNLERFVKNQKLAQQYVDGTLMIFRLAPYDYHRFHFPVDCVPSPAQKINGKLESVNPLVYKKGIQVLTENERHCIELTTEKYGSLLMVPIGALCVGKIIESYTPFQAMTKGSEAGYFLFGGSTVVLLIPNGVIKVNETFIKNSEAGFETAVTMGQKIGLFL